MEVDHWVEGTGGPADVTLRDGDRIQRTDLKAPKDRPSKADYRKEQEAIGLNTEYLLAQEEMKVSPQFRWVGWVGVRCSGAPLNAGV